MQTKPKRTRKTLLLAFTAAGLVTASLTAKADDYNNGPSAAARAAAAAIQAASQNSQSSQSASTSNAASMQAISGSDVPMAAVEESRVQRAQKLLSNVTDKASDVVLGALNYIGVRYKYGGNTPDSGLDCSGFVRYVFQDTLNFMLPRRSEEMSQVGERIAKTDLKPGDLVFFNTMRRSFSHVGIYIGGDKFVHAPATGGKIRVETLSESYWSARYNGARRVETLKASADLSRVEQIFKNDHPM
ncbi:Murein DD-endopeptidase MepH [Pandoraea pneumonica]|jgi:cell wall-associated NlpC family hydrolase|uniref:Murein DD-endopeptidase MepH n=1 Tax=Pandoraea pneumonica TaxID=2508299 RepID=A0A5E4TBK3_9BURK|nr:C40 family peptidase [Pandoraea pneumonica]VVD85510.1 Murein DD-endopeptidase MepH [Pandoraea pneumonica]